MKTRWLALLVMGTALASVTARAGEVSFSYGTAQSSRTLAPLLAGFEGGEGLALTLEMKRPAHCYIVYQHLDGSYRVAFPGGGSQADLPRVRLLHLSDDPRIARAFLVLSEGPVVELERAAGLAEAPAWLVQTALERPWGTGHYRRSIEAGTVRVRYREPGPAFVVEELVVRAES